MLSEKEVRGDYSKQRVDIAGHWEANIEKAWGSLNPLRSFFNAWENSGRAQQSGDFVKAQSHYAKAAAIYREFGDENRLANELWPLTITTLKLEEYAQAKLYAEESLETFRTLGDRVASADALQLLARSARF